MLDAITLWVSRLNLSSPLSAAGTYFQEIVALTCLMTGGFLILFGWNHHRYVLGMLGMLVGGWLGLLLKKHCAPMGVIPALPYLAVCGGIGALLSITLRRFVGIFLGGFASAVAAVVIFPAFVAPGQATYLALSVAFLLGGGLGALYPRFFFIFNTSLTGASLATYGLSVFLARAQVSPTTRTEWTLLHLGAFLPLLVGGIFYQYAKAPPEEATDLQPVRRTKPKAKAKPRPKEEPEPVGAK